jgi:hypothetical protein
VYIKSSRNLPLNEHDDCKPSQPDEPGSVLDGSERYSISFRKAQLPVTSGNHFQLLAATPLFDTEERMTVDSSNINQSSDMEGMFFFLHFHI